MEPLHLSDRDYAEFRRYLEDSCGIVLGDNKQYLVTSRLGSVLRQHGLATLADLLRDLQRDPRGKLRESVVDAMTTNETYWFRDVFPFEVLEQQLLPELAKRKVNPVRVWSAACSSGQEPYSISMVVSEYQQRNPGALTAPVEITATDISPAILKQAREGVYDELALARGLSPERRSRHFVKQAAGMAVRPELRARVRFSELNLLGSYALLGNFDVVFCRNVLIYFAQDAKDAILAKLARVLKPGGYLFLGASESLSAHAELFEMVRLGRGVVYRRL